MQRSRSKNLPRRRSAFFLCLALGGAYAAIFGTNPVRVIDRPWEALENAAACSFIGIVIGLFCSPLFVSWLARKRLALAGPILLLLALPTICLCANLAVVMFDYWAIPVAICLIVGAFLVYSRLLSRLLPDIVFDYPLCSFCGYDLTGNRSGTCPECGGQTEPQA